MSWFLPDLIKNLLPPPADQEGRFLWENAWFLEAFRQHDHPDQVPVAVPVPNAVRVNRERIAPPELCRQSLVLSLLI